MWQQLGKSLSKFQIIEKALIFYWLTKIIIKVHIANPFTRIMLFSLLLTPYTSKGKSKHVPIILKRFIVFCFIISIH